MGECHESLDYPDRNFSCIANLEHLPNRRKSAKVKMRVVFFSSSNQRDKPLSYHCLLFSVDTGDHNHDFGAFFSIFSSRRLLYPGGWTPMGFSPTSIIGGKLARPDLPAVCVTGDGGFPMVWSARK